MKKTSLASLIAQRGALNTQINQLMAKRLSPGAIVHVKDGSLCRNGKKDRCTLTRVPDTSIFRGNPLKFCVTCRRGHVVYLEDVDGWNNPGFTYSAKDKDIIRIF